MFDRFSRRLRLGATGTDGVDAGRSVTTASASAPLVEFVAYGEDCLLTARVRLAAERLTDLLNEHDELELRDVLVQQLDGSGGAETTSVVVPRDELLLVHAAGPRGSQDRRQRTRAHPVAVRTGPYHVQGYLHALPGSDPLNALRRRSPMVPLTDATIEFQADGERHRRSVGTLVVNREQVDWIRESDHVDVPTAKAPEVLVPEADTGLMVKDFTWEIVTAAPPLDTIA